jgi:WS/DGAT/MGAT family acyltransferase
MSAWEALMWRAEGDPRTRSTGVLLELLAHAPTWEDFRAAHRRAVQRIPRLRDRVIEPTVPVTEPHWSPDPAFDLDAHVAQISLGDQATERQLLDYTEDVFAARFDPAHPPWKAILVTGLEGGRAAYLLKVHHSMSDGLGLVQLLSVAQSSSAQIEDPHRDEASERTSDGRRAYTPNGLVVGRVVDVLREAPEQLLGTARTALRWGRQTALNPYSVVAYLRSVQRMITPPNAARSPLLNGTGVGNRLLILDVPFADLRKGAKASGGSVNDAFVAAMLGALRRYHERHDLVPDSIPIGVPVSLRKENDPMGGNNFTGAQLVAPLAEADPAERIRIIRELILTARDEPALGVMGDISGLLTKLPTPALVGLAANLTTTSDMQVSNIRGLTEPTYLAGAEVVGMYPLGPRPGVAVMVAMITYNGTCCLGFNVNPDVFTDLHVLEECLREGFAEVTALADDTHGTDEAASRKRK